MSMTPKSAIVAVAATTTTLLTAATGQTITLISLIFGNIDGTNDAAVTIYLTKSGGSAVTMISTLPVLVGEGVQVFVGGKDSLFLEAGDSISALASADGDITATMSYVVEE